MTKRQRIGTIWPVIKLHLADEGARVARQFNPAQFDSRSFSTGFSRGFS